MYASPMFAYQFGSYAITTIIVCFTAIVALAQPYIIKQSHNYIGTFSLVMLTVATLTFLPLSVLVIHH